MTKYNVSPAVGAVNHRPNRAERRRLRATLGKHGTAIAVDPPVILSARAPSGSALDVLPPDLRSMAENLLLNEIRRAVATEGMAAVACTREAAIAHEAGHAVVGAHEGFPVTRTRVWRSGPAWVGRTHNDEVMAITPETPAAADIGHSRLMIAGMVGEIAAGCHRTGSSLDEIIVGQLICANAAGKQGADPEALWRKVFQQTIEIIMGNLAVFEAVRSVLDAHEAIEGRALTELLAGVCRLPEGGLP